MRSEERELVPQEELVRVLDNIIASLKELEERLDKEDD